MRKRMRNAVTNGGAQYYLILWGVIWFLGFLGSHFLPDSTAGHVWMVLDIIGALGSWGLGVFMSRRVRNASVSATSGRIGLFWLALFAYCMLAVWIAWPLDSRQLAMFLIIFAMFGWIAMGFLLSYSLVTLALFITALAFGSYYLLPHLFYLCMALLGGGTMIGSGLYIRFRWRKV
ncbi:MAG: hypothetical protein NTW97_01590 [Candidatus Krumholzibacteria bacterium]|nr:hypothetical protein [Candidatus Krumholzibacteria bacterium]